MTAGDRRWTYEEFDRTVQHLAAALASIGVQCGDRVPDENLGEVVWAYVAARSPVAPAELQQFVRQKIAPYKVPEEIRFLEELPKGATGKVHRRSLREQAKIECMKRKNKFQ
ncbi:MAG: hypothetical protein H7Z17_18335 [Fuerstia sp.]|nr:hypothetical protein [Fuerstiella sp.]